jgi:hypothetical protein
MPLGGVSTNRTMCHRLTPEGFGGFARALLFS